MYNTLSLRLGDYMRDDIYKILSVEERDIIYSSKQDWFVLKDGKQDWSQSYDNISLFWKTLRRLISFDSQNSSCINLDYIAFPQFEKTDSSKDDNFFFIVDENTFEYEISFVNATFYGDSNFSNIIFKEKATFDKVKFKDEANFNKSEFHEEASFRNSTFNGDAYFKFVKFLKVSYFNRVQFMQNVSFRNSVFYAQSSFRRIVCSQDLYFWASSFKAKVDFWGAYCQGKVEFTSSKFNQEVFFWDVHFAGSSNYNNAVFSDNANFTNSKFKDISFSFSVFKKEADFSYTLFTRGSFTESSFYKLNFYQSVFKDAIFNNLCGFEVMKNVPISSSHIQNQETARIIKNFSIKQNNISDINKFYAIELEKIEKSLMAKTNYNIKDWLVIKAYKFTSCYSQNYILPLIWLVLSASIFTYFYPDKINAEIFVHLINPFELIMDYNLHIDYYVQAFASRIISLYFIYHFIISIKLKVNKK